MAFDPARLQAAKAPATPAAPQPAFDPARLQALKAPAEPNAAQPAQAAPAVAPRSDLDRAKNLVDAVRHGRTNDIGQVGSDALNLASAPFRGIRALTVGAGRVGTEPLSKTGGRMVEAVSSDFKPETTGEKLADASSKLLEIAAPLAQSSRAVKAGRMATELGTLKGANEALAGLKTKAGIDVEKAVEPIAKKMATPLVNALNNLKKADALKKLPIQDLHEAEVGLRNILDAEQVGGFARLMGKRPAGALTDQGIALAAKAKKAVVMEQNARVAGLEAARTRVGDVAARNRLVKKLIVGTLGGIALKKVLGSGAAPVMQAASEVSR